MQFEYKGVIMKKRIASFLASLLIVLPFITVSQTEAVVFPYKNTLYSEAAVLISMDTNEIISEKNPDLTQCPGSLVDIMTAVIVLENCKDLKKDITLDPEVYNHIYEELDQPEDLPTVDLKDGDVLKVDDLIYCMMLTSSIEAAEMLAYHVGGLIKAEDKNLSGTNTEVFVAKMNEKAEQLGMTSTKFTNAHGMYDPKQYTTARDMAKLTQYALTVPLFREIATTRTYTPVVPNPERHPHQDEWVWTHSNIMMDEEDQANFYMGAKGIKTAKLEAAGRNIITLASKNGYNYLVVLMKAPFKDEEGNQVYCHIEDATNMLDWAFQHFSKQVLLASTAEMGERPVKLADTNGKNYVIARPKDTVEVLWCDEVETSLVNKDKIVWNKDSFQAPIKQGDSLGSVTLIYSGEELATVELVAVSDVNRSKTAYNFEVAKRFHKSPWFKTAIKISIALSILYIIICIYALVLFKSSKKPLKPIYAVPKMDKKKKKSINKKNTNRPQ